MPNHITTELIAPPEVLRTLLNDENEVDFELIVPMPEEVKDTEVGSNGLDMFDTRGWYGWSVANWGTKWNAYSTFFKGENGDRAVVTFDTAWSPPVPIIEALSKKFPEALITARWADEDIGSGVGEYDLLDGMVIEDRTPEPGSDAANDFATMLKYGQTYAEYSAEWADE